ncbi:thiol peroxidase, atypical 2-Cys peroxiredoxin [Reichenbachiella faecimaris]|uniref:Thiol peroxidase n=1 Tax=Reichenbachiella faecimaris TaxID=692418 RepID=A0A1W2G980_REIFA|nr:thiol peroxidase [Reichenbachiella faecimaris]SMD32898.1 thiol peroxidase, atypical 2-Cys peroxiredoxin [Reichenbachiella faecimaris]
MASITLKGNTINTIGHLPANGSQAPDFDLVKNDLSHISLADYKGSRVILNIFPSIDTGICAASVRTFNEKASGLANTKILCISRDLPFAQARFCGAEGIDSVETVSDFTTGQFGKDYEVTIIDGPMAHLHSRAIVILDENHTVIYSEQVPEIVQDPDFEKALAALA